MERSHSVIQTVEFMLTNYVDIRRLSSYLAHFGVFPAQKSPVITGVSEGQVYLKKPMRLRDNLF
jgi:hypothetical protein